MDIGEILANLGFDWRVALANLVNFLVIIWILKRFAFKPIEQKIKEREDKIKQGIEDAERSAAELQMAQQLSEKTAMDARNQANEIIALAQKESEKIISEAKLLQQEQIKQTLVKTDRAIQQERQKMLSDLKKEVAELVISATEKFLKEDLPKEKQEQIIERLIKEK